MRPVWEEFWDDPRLHPSGRIMLDYDPEADNPARGGIVEFPDGDDQRGRERGRLASAAPEMTRVLLAVEWSGKCDYVGDGGYDCCPACEGIAPEDAAKHDAVSDAKAGAVVGHARGCALDVALRKAGVR